MNLLDKNYTAISSSGEEFYVLNIENIIRHYGFRVFLSNFGMFHQNHGNYVLVDGVGKIIDPMLILIDFNSRFPGFLNKVKFKKSKKHYFDGTSYGSRHRTIKQAFGALKEEGEPEIRNRTWSLNFSHFDDPCFGSKSYDSWKNHRKKQYKS